MTREERKAERRAQQARIATKVWAMMAAKDAVKAKIRADGLKVCHFEARTITSLAEEWLAKHPELIAKAREQAQRFYCPQQQT